MFDALFVHIKNRIFLVAFEPFISLLLAALSSHVSAHEVICRKRLQWVLFILYVFHFKH